MLSDRRTLFRVPQSRDSFCLRCRLLRAPQQHRRRSAGEQHSGRCSAHRDRGRQKLAHLHLAQRFTALWVPLAIVTRYDYYMTMTGIRIADLKSRLSEHLRKVRAGSSLTILDRDTPIARIVPWKAGNGSLKLRAPLPGAPKLQRVPLPPPLRLRGDVVKLLMEERQGDR